MTDADPRRWRDAFRACKEEAAALAEGLSSEAFNRPPEEGAWSVGQCLDHLHETARPLVPGLESALAACPPRQASGGGPRLRWRDRLFVWTMEPGGWLKVPSPGAYRPAEGALDPEAVTRAFAGLQDDLAACAERAEGRDWSAEAAASPASRWMRLSAGGWLAGTLAHQRRHLRQARRTRAAVAGG